MKGYHIFFYLLRIVVTGQIILVVLKKNVVTQDIKIVIDTLLKLSIGFFIIFFFWQHDVGLDRWDIFILQFAGIVIIADIDYTDFLAVVRKVYPGLSSKLDILKSVQRYPTKKVIYN